jgi:hypothetical protein
MTTEKNSFITILNWQKFNPRKDVSNSSWFRLEHKQWFLPEWEDFNGQEMHVWNTLLAIASFQNSGTFPFRISYIAKTARLEEKYVKSAIEKLKDLNCISIDKQARDVDVTEASRERSATDGRTDETDETLRDESVDLPAHAGAPTPDELVQVWNNNCGALPKVERLSSKRVRKAKSRLREEPDISYWEKVITRMAQSNFCQGEKGWIANFDFLLQPDTHVKVMEGKYDNRAGPGPKTKHQLMSENNQRLFALVESGEA